MKESIRVDDIGLNHLIRVLDFLIGDNIESLYFDSKQIDIHKFHRTCLEFYSDHSKGYKEQRIGRQEQSRFQTTLDHLFEICENDN